MAAPPPRAKDPLDALQLLVNDVVSSGPRCLRLRACICEHLLSFLPLTLVLVSSSSCKLARLSVRRAGTARATSVWLIRRPKRNCPTPSRPFTRR